MKRFSENDQGYREVRIKGQRFSPEVEAKMHGARIERTLTERLQKRPDEYLEFRIIDAAFLGKLAEVCKLESPNLLRVQPGLISIVDGEKNWYPLPHEDIGNMRKMIIETMRLYDEDFIQGVDIDTVPVKG